MAHARLPESRDALADSSPRSPGRQTDAGGSSISYIGTIGTFFSRSINRLLRFDPDLADPAGTATSAAQTIADSQIGWPESLGFRFRIRIAAKSWVVVSELLLLAETTVGQMFAWWYSCR